MKVALIDGDILVYQVASSAETPIHWGDDLWTLHSSVKEAVPNMIEKINEIETDLKADRLIFTLTTTARNFRKDVYPKYKENRKAVRKPLAWKPLREWVAENYETVERPHLEGDDCLGILATNPGTCLKDAEDGRVEKIIVSIDKDFKTIPCTYYNLTHKTTMVITEADANYWFMYQTLTGDTTDGYPGCPTIGPKNAERILAPFRGEDGSFDLAGAWLAVVEQYAKKGLGVGVALQMARCARILRASDYDFKNKKPLLWEPPQ